MSTQNHQDADRLADSFLAILDEVSLKGADGLDLCYLIVKSIENKRPDVDLSLIRDAMGVEPAKKRKRLM